MYHYAKTHSVWRIFDFVNKFFQKWRKRKADKTTLRQTQPENNCYEVYEMAGFRRFQSLHG